MELLPGDIEEHPRKRQRQRQRRNRTPHEIGALDMRSSKSLSSSTSTITGDLTPSPPPTDDGSPSHTMGPPGGDYPTAHGTPQLEPHHSIHEVDFAIRQGLFGGDSKPTDGNEYDDLAGLDEDDLVHLADAVAGTQSTPGVAIDNPSQARATSHLGQAPNAIRHPVKGLMSETLGPDVGDGVMWDNIFTGLPVPQMASSSTARASPVRVSHTPSASQRTLPLRGSRGFTETHRRHQNTPPRPSFPSTQQGTALNSSPSPSKSATLRPCFRIGEFMNEGVRCFRAGQDVAFELFARVSHSSRVGSTQYFEFKDLFTEHPPHPTGAMIGARDGGQIDRESWFFIGDSQPQMCRCVCRLKEDRGGKLGWTVVVFMIRVVDWEEVNLMRQIVGHV